MRSTQYSVQFCLIEIGEARKELPSTYQGQITGLCWKKKACCERNQIMKKVHVEQMSLRLSKAQWGTVLFDLISSKR